jgi:hypothetical protein
MKFSQTSETFLEYYKIQFSLNISITEFCLQDILQGLQEIVYFIDFPKISSKSLTDYKNLI